MGWEYGGCRRGESSRNVYVCIYGVCKCGVCKRVGLRTGVHACMDLEAKQGYMGVYAFVG